MNTVPQDSLRKTDVSPQSEERLLLSDCVRTALTDYFQRLDGHPVGDLYEMVIAEVERPLILTVLEHCGYNQSKAAQALGLSRSTLRKKITHYGLD